MGVKVLLKHQVAMVNLVTLGPQRHNPHILKAAASCNLEAPWASITAGWQEREDEIEELEAHLGQSVHNLRLYHRAEEIFQSDPLLREAIRHHQQQLIGLQELYRLRLRYAMETVHKLLLKKRPNAALLEPEIEDSFQTVRQLDAHHLGRIKTMNDAFSEKWDLSSRPSVQQHREEIAQILDRCACLLIAGGHVAILLNRMRLFGLPGKLQEKPIIAWSAGAMVLGEKIVLFHDSPPQGRGYAEVLESGLGCYSGRLFFPSANQRLSLDDPIRVQLLARRFSSDACWTLNSGAKQFRQNGQWHRNDLSTRLMPTGEHQTGGTP